MDRYKLIIAGGRDYRLTAKDRAVLDRIGALHGWKIDVLTGGQTGADSDGKAWARSHGIEPRTFKAEWTLYGLAAKPIRNREMALIADGVVLFPGHRGTNSMFREAVAAGLDIFDERGCIE